MMRVLLSAAVFGAIFGASDDAFGGHRRGCRPRCCNVTCRPACGSSPYAQACSTTAPSTPSCCNTAIGVVVDSVGSAGADKAVGVNETGEMKHPPVSAKEELLWKELISKNLAKESDYDLLWKNASTAERKSHYDEMMTIARKAAEEADREQKELVATEKSDDTK